MTKARRAIAGVVVGAAMLAAVPAAQAQATATTADPPVTVTREGDYIYVRSRLGTQPLFGASLNTSTLEVCVGFSYQVPFCTPEVGLAISDPFDGKPPVIVDVDPSDGVVGVGTRLGDQPLLSVWYRPATGTLCARFSYQIPVCVGGN